MSAIRKKKITACAAAVLIASAVVCSCADSTIGLDRNIRPEAPAVPAAATGVSTVQTTATVEPTTEAETTTEPATEPPDDLSELEKQINEAVRGYKGEWSVYVKNLRTGRSTSVNNKMVYAASLIKLFAMGAAYSKVQSGEIKEEDIIDNLEKMIEVSSNEAFNSIVRLIGLQYTTEWCKDNGYDDTYVEHGLQPASNSKGLQIYINNGTNYTSVEDVGHFLEEVYLGECVSEEYSAKMLELLKAQKYTQKIPAGVPDGIVTANKTGETDEVCHDAAIIYSYECDYILVVMSSAPSGSAWDNEDDVTALSALVYDYFN